MVNDTGDLPESVRDTLRSTFDDARDAMRSGDTETTRHCMAIASRVVKYEVPPGEVAERLEHGIEAVERTAADEPVVAAEYLRLLREMFDEADD